MRCDTHPAAGAPVLALELTIGYVPAPAGGDARTICPAGKLFAGAATSGYELACTDDSSALSPAGATSCAVGLGIHPCGVAPPAAEDAESKLLVAKACMPPAPVWTGLDRVAGSVDSVRRRAGALKSVAVHGGHGSSYLLLP